MSRKYRVLAVDDEPESVELIHEYLASRGYEVSRALSGENALRMLNEERVDLVLLDVKMPGIDGYEVLRQIRQNEATRLIPVVMITALDSKEDKIKGIENGCDDFISKPFDMREVQARIKMLLEYNYYRSQLHEKERFDSIVHRMEDGVVVLDGNLRICRINSVAAKLLNISQRDKPEDFLRHLQKQFVAHYNGDFAGDITRTMILCDLERVRADNEPEVILNLKTTIIRASDGKVTDIIMIMRDVTERKQAEEKLKHAYTYLKRTQFQLVQAAKMSCIGTLVGSVAHEINNPLGSVLIGVQFLKTALSREDIPQEQIVETVHRLETSVKRCIHITQSLLDLSYASKGSFEPVSLNEVVEKVCTFLEHDMSMYNIDMEWKLHPELPLVKGNIQLLQQVLLDLVVNARWAIKKKSENGGGSIVIRTSADRARGMVDLSISDTGVGIAEENLKKVFEPFFTTKKVGEGTGLGLSIVGNILKEHNGTISVESELGKGTTFIVSLPLC